MKKVIIIVTLALSIFSFSKAQSLKEFQIGVSTPTVDLADDDGLAAGTGLYVNYKTLIPVQKDGLYITLNIGLIYNGLNSNDKQDLKDTYDDAGIDNYKIAQYFNIPVLAGLHYEMPITEGELSIWGEGGLGVNIINITDDYVEEGNGSTTKSYTPSLGLAYKVGGGITIKDKYSIGVFYNGLGSHEIKYETEFAYSSASYTTDGTLSKMTLGSVNIALGYRF